MKKPITHDTQFNLVLPPELRNALDAVRQRDGVSYSEQVRRALMLYFEQKDIPVTPAQPRRRSHAA